MEGGLFGVGLGLGPDFNSAAPLTSLLAIYNALYNKPTTSRSKVEYEQERTGVTRGNSSADGTTR